MHIYVYIYIHTYIHIYIHTYIHIYIYIYSTYKIYIRSTYTYTVHMHIHTVYIQIYTGMTPYICLKNCMAQQLHQVNSYFKRLKQHWRWYDVEHIGNTTLICSGMIRSLWWDWHRGTSAFVDMTMRRSFWQTVILWWWWWLWWLWWWWLWWL